MSMPKNGTATATFKSVDGEMCTLILPATYLDEKLIISAESRNVAVIALQAAGVDRIEFEFNEVES